MAKGGAPAATAFNSPAQQAQCNHAASTATNHSPSGQPSGWLPEYQQEVANGYDPRAEWHRQRWANMQTVPWSPQSFMTPGQQAGTQLSAPQTGGPGITPVQPTPTIQRNYVGGGLLAPFLDPASSTIHPGAQTIYRDRGGLLSQLLTRGIHA